MLWFEGTVITDLTGGLNMSKRLKTGKLNQTCTFSNVMEMAKVFLALVDILIRLLK
jgi:hypothetical protein